MSTNHAPSIIAVFHGGSNDGYETVIPEMPREIDIPVGYCLGAADWLATDFVAPQTMKRETYRLKYEKLSDKNLQAHYEIKNK